MLRAMSRRAREVVGRAGGEVAEHEVLGGAPAEEHRQLVLELLARHQVAVVGRPLHRVAERADPARDDRHLVHRVACRGAPRPRARGPSRGGPRSRAPAGSAAGCGFSRPATMRSIAAVKSSRATASAPWRVATRAASFTRFARSAPVKPGVSAAIALEVDARRELHLAQVDVQDLRRGRAGRGGRRAPGGRSAPRGAAPGRGSPAGSSRRGSRSRATGRSRRARRGAGSASAPSRRGRRTATAPSARGRARRARR